MRKTEQLNNSHEKAILKKPHDIPDQSELTDHISKEKLQEIHQLTNQNPIAEFVIYLSVYAALLKRYLVSDSVVISIEEFKGKSQERISHNSVLPLSLSIDCETSLRDTIRQVKKQIEDRLETKDTETTNLNDDTVQNTVQLLSSFGFYYSEANMTVESRRSSCYCSLSLESDRSLKVQIVYNKSQISSRVVKKIIEHFHSTVSKINNLLDVKIGSLSCLSEYELAELRAFGGTPEKIQHNLATLFDHQVRSRADKVAIRHLAEEITYAQLDAKSSQLAKVLADKYSVKRGARVGVLTDYSINTIVAFLAILKLRAVYVPLDPKLPYERLKYMLSDSSSEVLVINSDYYEKAINAGLPWLAVDLESLDGATSNIEVGTAEPYEPVYIMYTSGSSGQPKGTIITNNGIIRLVISPNYAELSERESILGISNCTFDGSTFDIWGSLLNGATLTILDQQRVLDYELLQQEISENKISTVFLTTALFNSLVDQKIEMFASLKQILFGGEMVSVKHVNAFKATYQNAKLIHVYGPTENTTFSTYYPVVDQQYADTVPIGRPVSSTQCFILNEHMQYQPIGVIGELFVSGDGLAQGYLNNERLTNEKFIPNPFQDGKKMYRTGDYCRWLPSGDIEILGRVDSQIKIRGFRIELAEIEAHLINIPGIKRCCVIAANNHTIEKTLTAFIVSDSLANINELKHQLRETLPEYMIPATFMPVKEIPLTPNGKVDKEALLKFYTQTETREIHKDAPATQTEKKLVAIWKKILGRTNISTTDVFFDIGGHSLRAAQLVSLIHKELNVKIKLRSVFSLQTIQKLAEHIDNQIQNDFESIDPAPVADNYSVSSSQYRLWILHQFEGAKAAYNISGVFKVEKQIEKDILEKAVNTVIERHEILRTYFAENSEMEVRQYVVASQFTSFRINYKNLENATEDEIQKYIKARLLHNFDLSQLPLIQFNLLRIKPDEHIIVCAMHHIISDGLSCAVFIKEILEIYNDLKNNQPIRLPALRIQYKDYAEWQKKQSLTEKLLAQKNYWVNKFAGEIPLLTLPFNQTRPAVKTYRGQTVTRLLNQNHLYEFNQFCAEQSCTAFMGIIAVTNLLFFKYTGNTDIILGTPVAGRDHADLNDQIGFYVNTLALRTCFDRNDTFEQLVDNIKNNFLEALENQLYPFDELVNHLKLSRDLSRNPLFDVMVTYQRVGGAGDFSNLLNEVNVVKYKTDRNVSKFDLELEFIETESGLEINLVYDNDIYLKENIELMAEHLCTLFTSTVAQRTDPLWRVPYMSHSERTNLLNVSRGEEAKYDDNSIVHLIEEQTRISSDRIAVIFEEKNLSYATLNICSNQLARYLINTYNVSSEDRIAIHLERNEWTLIAMLAVLKAGGAYVPISINYPKERVDFIISDSECKVIINDDLLKSFQKQKSHIDESNIRTNIKPTDLAYIIYTSGSTGLPKGVLIEHKSLLDYVVTFQKKFGIANPDKIIHQSSISFDTHIEEIYPGLISGATIIISKHGGSDIEELEQLITKHSATVLSTTPSVIAELNSESRNISPLRLLISGGEKLLSTAISNYIGKLTIHDGYGPTESTVASTFIQLKETGTKCIIGRPIANRTVYVLDNFLDLLPIGVVGEICIGGAGLARGYLNRPELTAEKFVEDPYRPGERIYRTGDLGRWLSDGNLEFIGRSDDQIKIQGYRIELGEVEGCLLCHPQINNVVVQARENKEGIQQLIAYFTASERLNFQEIRNFLLNKLPVYMIPTKFVQLDKLPVTLHGKIDKKALNDLENVANDIAISRIMAESTLEKKIVEVWSEILGINKETIGMTDNFFELGGNSIKIIKLKKRLTSELGKEIDIITLFNYPNIKSFIAYIQDESTGMFISEEVNMRDIHSVLNSIKETGA